MAKKKAIATKSRAKVRFHAFLRQGDIAPWIREEKWSTDPWIWHGSDNLFPEHLRTLVDNCGPLERSITMLAQFIAGHGLRFYGPPTADGKQGPELPEAQKRFQEWMGGASEEEFLWRCAYDLAHGLGVSFNVRRSATEIVRLDHLDRFGLRSGKIKDGIVDEYWWSSDWRRYHENPTDPTFKPRPLRAWMPGSTDPLATVFRKVYRPREPYYGGLKWLGAWTAAEVWTKVDNYNRTQIDLGFAPAIALGTRFDGTESEQDQHDLEIEKAYTGSMGRGVFHFPLGPDEQEPFFKELARGNHAGELDAMRTGAADVVYDIFGIPSLLMRDRSEGLTSQERAIAIRLQQMQRTVVEPLQKFITQPIQQLLADAGVKVYEVKFNPLEIFDPVQSEAVVLASTTVDEAREQRGVDELGTPDGKELLVKVKGGTTAQDLEAKQQQLEQTLAAKQDQVPANGKK